MIDHLIPDIPRLYSAITEWLACMIFILAFKKRFSKIKTGVIMAVMLVVQSGFMVVTEDVSLFFWIPCMMVAVFLMLFFIYVSCAIEITDAVYFVLIAFVVAEFMASRSNRSYAPGSFTSASDEYLKFMPTCATLNPSPGTFSPNFKDMLSSGWIRKDKRLHECPQHWPIKRFCGVDLKFMVISDLRSDNRLPVYK